MRMGHRRRAVFALVAIAVLVVAGCSSSEPSAPQTKERSALRPIKIGTLPTEDALPLWVAEREGYFAQEGLSGVEIVVFQSAQERDAAFSSGAIDAFMGDIIAAASLEAAGSGVTIATVMLGADPSEGRFGVVAAPGTPAGAATLPALAAKGIGTSSATIQEYVLDGLMREAGVSRSAARIEEVKKVPVRFELLMQRKLAAAALPEPFLSLAVAQGAVLVADDTRAKTNLSQTILGVSDDFMRSPGGAPSVDALLAAWDRAAADVNADPGSFRGLLVDKARLPEALRDTYPVNRYPSHQLPKQSEVEAVISWMRDKGYLKADVTFEDLTLVLPE